MMAGIAYAQSRWRTWLAMGGLVLLALAVRLLVWRWREFYGLGGDEREYLAQAITLLQQRQYTELRLMRPPLYTLFLAGSIQLVDSLVQNLRLVQAVLSALTAIPMWLLAQEVDQRHPKTDDLHNSSAVVPFVACVLLALCYTLAANATELLSETLFLFGLTTVFWLLLRAARSIRHGLAGGWPWIVAAGLGLGLLCLVRSVALPLVPLGALWLFFQTNQPRDTKTTARVSGLRFQVSHLGSLLFLACSLLTIAPWTVRNYVTYGALIIIDTTGAENLWLDNNPTASTPDDPLGREDAKRQLYDLGDDRAARQRLASQRGLEAITSHPDWFIAKASGELVKFFALEYSDDMRARPAIWHPPAEVWMRLLLGDAFWLMISLGGLLGLVLAKTGDSGMSTLPGMKDKARRTSGWNVLPLSLVLRLSSSWHFLPDPRVLFVPWLLYSVVTAMLFHVELRYRLPVYPVLIVYTALLLATPRRLVWRPVRVAVAALLVAVCLVLTFLHASYPTLAWQLGWKHYHLWQAERALTADDADRAEEQARAAAALDDTSALAHVALARAALLRDDRATAQVLLETAISLKRAHPHAHLLLGDLLRVQGQDAQAQPELAFETGSLEDLQRWSWERFVTPPPARLDIGGGLDLGFVQGFHSAEQAGWRWTTDRALLRLRLPAGSPTLTLRLASGRPAGALTPALTVFADGRAIGTLDVAPDWATYTLPLPTAVEEGELVVELLADTFTPRSYDRTSDDGRTLGVMLDWAEVGR